MKNFCFALILIFALAAGLAGCKTNQFNKQGKRIGRWEFTDTLGTEIYRTTGRYRNGIERGTWKYYAGNRLERLEKYRKNISQHYFYRENGQIHSQGKARLDVSDSLIHWYYFGDWQFFDEHGRLTTIKTFENGQTVKVQKIDLPLAQ